MGIYDTLNDRQKEAVFHTEGPVLILAGAGSGKTRVLTHRIAYLLETCEVKPWNIMAITFTNKAAEEMRTRVDALVGLGSESIWVSTFHASCVRMLRRYADRIGYDTNFAIYDADDQKTVMKEVCKKLQIDTKTLKERTILSAISKAKDSLIGPVEYEMQAFGDYNRQKIAKAYTQYQETLRKNNAMDFDDLIMQTVELLKSIPEVCKNYQERFRYIMVDEYQDTNTAQFELIRLLAAGSRNLCVVGDDDQSIYKFRGANIRNILDFEKVYPDAFVVKLEQNYRSTQNILDAANAVIQNNIGRKEKALWTQEGSGNRLHFRQFETAYEEAQFIASDVRDKYREGMVRYSDCAVLYRTNAQSRLLEEQFIQSNIPYCIVGGVNFYARKEIKDLLAYLKTIDNAKDDLAVRRIINIPKRGIGQTTIGKVQSYADEKQISFYDALCEAQQIPGIGRSASKLEPFVNMIRVFRSRLTVYSLSDLLQDILDTTGYIEQLQAESEEEVQARIENIDELISKIVSYEESIEEPTLSGFLEEVALVADIDNVDQNQDKVLLMTLHSAKGLEFAHVYLSGMEDGVFPGYMTIMSDDSTELEEERRLAYVGITRAKKDLTLTMAKQRMIRGETQYNPVSRFLREIPEQLLDNRLPVYKRDFSDYEDDSSERSFFTRRPYDMMSYAKTQEQVSKLPFRTSGRTAFQTSASQKPSASAWQKSSPQMSQQSAPGTKMPQFSQTEQPSWMRAKPKAVLAKKVTQDSVRPYVSKAGSAQPNMSQAALAYKEGDRVRHIRFGDGTVKQMEPGPKDTKVTVEFDTCGQKVMYAAFAKLQKI